MTNTKTMLIKTVNTIEEKANVTPYSEMNNEQRKAVIINEICRPPIDGVFDPAKQEWIDPYSRRAEIDSFGAPFPWFIKYYRWLVFVVTPLVLVLSIYFLPRQTQVVLLYIVWQYVVKIGVPVSILLCIYVDSLYGVKGVRASSPSVKIYYRLYQVESGVAKYKLLISFLLGVFNVLLMWLILICGLFFVLIFNGVI